VAPELKVSTGNYTDTYFKANYAHTFANGLIWGGLFQYTFKPSDDQYQTETTLGYKWQLNNIWAVPFSGGVGYLWDQKQSSTPSQQFAYYVMNVGLDMKLSENWTWNVVSGRYRDAFEGGWQTPKVATGLSYHIDRQNSIYGSVGYGWKNGAPDKLTLAAGYRFGF
jgi:hypothetical protein